MGLVQQAGEHPPKGIPFQTPQTHSYAQHEEHQRHEERGDIFSRVFEGFPPISAPLSFACHWTWDLHWEAPHNHSFEQFFLKAPDMV